MREGRRGRTLPGHGSKQDIRFGATKVEKLATNMDLLCLLYLVTSLAACCLSNCLIAKERDRGKGESGSIGSIAADSNSQSLVELARGQGGLNGT